MEMKTRFGKWETVSLAANITCMQIYLNFPRTMVESSATAAWIQTIYISLLAIAAFAVIARLLQNFEGKDIIDMGEYLGGNVGRIVIGLIYAAYATIFMVIVLREFGENMKTVALPNSPLSFVVIFFVLAIIAGGFLGFEAVVRLNNLLFPALVLGYIIIIIAVAPRFEFDNLTPILGSGLNDIFIKGSSRVSVYAGLFALVLIPQYINNHKIFRKAGYITLLLTALFLTSAVMAFQLTSAYPRSIQHFLPIYSMARGISYGRFFQRVESIFVFMWAASGMLYLAAIFNLALNSLQKAFKLNYIKPLIIPLIIIIYTLSFFPASLMSVIKIEGDYLRSYAWLVLIALPIIILAIANIKKSKVKRRRK